jgi:putative PIN family toxin of toxin-antitoxin system
LNALVHQCELIDIHETVQVCRDRQDDKIFDVAINGDAHCIVTGDADLLVLHPFQNITILTVQDFLNQMTEV